MKENELVTKAAGVVGIFTFLSRVMGLARDILIASFFGSGLVADAFFVAFRIPNLFRRLFAEGSFSVSFIPIFTEYLQKKSKHEAIYLAQIVLTVIIIILTSFTIIGIVFSPLLIRIIAPGFGGLGEKYYLAVFLTRIMFPYIFLVSLLSLFSGVLNSLKHFSAPAAAPIFLNLSMIAALIFLAPHMKVPSAGLAIGVIGGGFLQLALQIPFLVNKGMSFAPKWNIRHPALKKIVLLMVPTIFGSAIYQINQLIGTLLASFLREGSISYLYYADRLVQFPLGVFAIAISTAVLPSLSREASKGEIDMFKDTLSHAMRLTMFITIPAMVGLIVLRQPIVKLLFERGAFSSFSTLMTANALAYYSLGLCSFAGLRIFVSAFYSLQDTKIPAKVAAIAMIFNVIFSLILMGPLKHGGLALALSLASTLQLLILIFLLHNRLNGIKGMVILRSMARSFISSIVMGAFIYLIYSEVLGKYIAQSTLTLTLGLSITISSGIAIYFVSAKLLGSEEIVSIKEIFTCTSNPLKSKPQ
jgi:putative peptidoglycan lipid II flippase